MDWWMLLLLALCVLGLIVVIASTNLSGLWSKLEEQRDQAEFYSGNEFKAETDRENENERDKKANG